MPLASFWFMIKTKIVFIFFGRKYDHIAIYTNTEMLLVAGRGFV